MFLNIEGYSPTMIQNMDLSNVTTEEINRCLKNYLDHYSNCLINQSQRKYVDIFVKGLLSDLDRKSIELIELSFLDEKEVHGFQQFFKRSKLPDNEMLFQFYKIRKLFYTRGRDLALYTQE